MDRTVRLGKIWGIPVGVNYSWLVVFVLFAALMADRYGETYPWWPLAQRWGIALVTAILFFASVLAHELSHSVVAMRKGIPVRGITLFIFGGVSQLAHEAQRPLTEFLVAIVGPLTSLLLAAGLGGLAYAAGNFSVSLAAVLSTLFIINLSLAIFNMLPGFPLDGGRVLRSAIWGATGSYWRGTQVATRFGQLLGLLMVVGGIAWFFLLGFQGLWLALIGGFLLVAATASYREERHRESLRGYRVADAMVTQWEAVPGHVPISSPQVSHGLAGRADFLAVLVDGRMAGIVTRRSLGRIPRAKRPGTSLADAMLPWPSLPKVSPQAGVHETLHRMDAEDVDRVVVAYGEVPLGFFTRRSALRLARLRRPRP